MEIIIISIYINVIYGLLVPHTTPLLLLHSEALSAKNYTYLAAVI